MKKRKERRMKKKRWNIRQTLIPKVHSVGFSNFLHFAVNFTRNGKIKDKNNKWNLLERCKFFNSSEFSKCTYMIRIVRKPFL